MSVRSWTLACSCGYRGSVSSEVLSDMPPYPCPQCGEKIVPLPSAEDLARALVREAVASACSDLNFGVSAEVRQGYTLRLLESMVDDDRDAESTLHEAGLRAVNSRHFHRRYDAFFLPLLRSELGLDEEAPATAESPAPLPGSNATAIAPTVSGVESRLPGGGRLICSIPYGARTEREALGELLKSVGIVMHSKRFYELMGSDLMSKLTRIQPGLATTQEKVTVTLQVILTDDACLVDRVELIERFEPQPGGES